LSERHPYNQSGFASPHSPSIPATRHSSRTRALIPGTRSSTPPNHDESRPPPGTQSSPVRPQRRSTTHQPARSSTSRRQQPASLHTRIAARASQHQSRVDPQESQSSGSASLSTQSSQYSNYPRHNPYSQSTQSSTQSTQPTSQSTQSTSQSSQWSKHTADSHASQSLTRIRPIAPRPSRSSSRHPSEIIHPDVSQPVHIQPAPARVWWTASESQPAHPGPTSHPTSRSTARPPQSPTHSLPPLHSQQLPQILSPHQGRFRFTTPITVDPDIHQSGPPPITTDPPIINPTLLTPTQPVERPHPLEGLKLYSPKRHPLDGLVLVGSSRSNTASQWDEDARRLIRTPNFDKFLPSTVGGEGNITPATATELGRSWPRVEAFTSSSNRVDQVAGQSSQAALPQEQSGIPPRSRHTPPPTAISPPTLRPRPAPILSIRAHSSSLSSTLSLPAKLDSSSPISHKRTASTPGGESYSKRKKDEPLDSEDMDDGGGNTPLHELDEAGSSKRSWPKRGGERRRFQNATAQKRHRDKKRELSSKVCRITSLLCRRLG
jgi:hypothetical protein